VAELVRAAWALGARPGLAGLRLRAWAHMLGFRSHWSTKSRRYSTTMTALRRARVQFAKRRRARDGVPLDAWGRAEDDEDQAAVVIATWSYVGAGYQTQGEVWLALSAAARANSDRWPGRNYGPGPPDATPRKGGKEAWRLLLTAEETAAILRIGRTKVYELMRLGLIESVKIRGSRRIPIVAVHDYVERLRREAVA
jgi:excisionase family DNA binding protein